MSCYNPWGETQEFVIQWASYGMRAKAQLDALLEAHALKLATLEKQASDIAQLRASNVELANSLDRLCSEIILSDIDPAYIESHFRCHIAKARLLTSASRTKI